MNKTHILKTFDPYYYEIENGEKNFELRKNDRDYKVGDILILKQFSLITGFSGLFQKRKIKYILKDAEEFGLKKGYVILGLHEKL